MPSQIQPSDHLEPGYAVLSGPMVRRNDCKRALEGAGFSLLSDGPLPADPTVPHVHRGLSSYRNPLEAAEAGAENAGHTPGTPHPETGEDYEGDGRIGFLDVRLPETEGALDEIARLAQGARFTLRLHTTKELISRREPELSTEQRLEIAEAQLAAIRMERLRASGVPLGAITSPPYALQQSSHSAQLFRGAISSPLGQQGGLVNPADFAVTQNGTPNMSVNVGAGRIWVPSTYLATVNPGGGAYYPGGLYFAENDAAVNLAISAANATNPRLDQTIVQVQDAAYSGVTNSAQLAILTGTPTSGAALNNLVGLASLPASSMLLTYVLVPANATTIVTANISANQAPPLTTGIGGTGHTNIPASQSTSSTSYTTLATPDQVTVALPANGLIRVWYQATWQESVSGAARALVFLGGNGVVQATASGAPILIEAQMAGTAGNNRALATSSSYGLTSGYSTGGGYTGDVTTGEMVGQGTNMGGPSSGVAGGGPCDIFATAGTYTVSVQFKASSGSVTASNRKLWVQVLPFA